MMIRTIDEIKALPKDSVIAAIDAIIARLAERNEK